MPVTPSDQLAMLDERARAAHSSALVILQGSEVALQRHYDGSARPTEAMSVAKAVVNLVVGRAVTLNLLPGVDLPVGELFPEWRQGRKRAVTLRMLMNHTSGLQCSPTTEEIYASPDFVQLALCAELSHEPGQHFAYNNKAVNLIAGLIGRVSGRPLHDFARAELLAPLGITEDRWMTDTAGNPQCMAGLQLLPADLARLGQLLLTRGAHAGQQLIAPEWFDLSLNPTSEVFGGIGLLWWLIRDGAAGPIRGYKHDGYLGQYLIVVPGAQLVAVRMIDWAHPRAQEPASLFPDFEALVLALSRP